MYFKTFRNDKNERISNPIQLKYKSKKVMYISSIIFINVIILIKNSN